MRPNVSICFSNPPSFYVITVVVIFIAMALPCSAQIAPGIATGNTQRAHRKPNPYTNSDNGETTKSVNPNESKANIESNGTPISGNSSAPVQLKSVAPKGVLPASAPGISYVPLTAFYSVVGDQTVQKLMLSTSDNMHSYTVTKVDVSANSFSASLCDPATLDQYALTPCAIPITYSPSAPSGNSSLVEDDVVLTVTVLDNQSKISSSFTVDLVGVPARTCAQSKGFQNFTGQYLVPLSHHGVDDVAVRCYYSQSQNYAFVSSVQYQYNPGDTANAVSTDLLSLQFLPGFQITLGAAAANSSCTSASTSTAPATSSSCSGSSASSTQGTQPSLAQDIQSLETGGNFTLKALYPLFQHTLGPLQLASIMNPKAGFTVSGLSSQSSAVSGTDANYSVTTEEYLQYDALPAKSGGVSPGSLFFDYRGGWQHVSSTFQMTAMLPNQNFYLQQLSAGLVITGGIRLAAERYFGPSQAFIDSSGNHASTNNFAGWQLRVQISPSALAGK